MVTLRRGKKQLVREKIPIENVDTSICTEKLKGDVDDYGRCIVDVELDSDELDVATLHRVKFVRGSTGPVGKAPSLEPKPKRSEEV